MLYFRYVMSLIKGEIAYTHAPLPEVFSEVARRVKAPYDRWLVKMSAEMERREEYGFARMWHRCAERYLGELNLKYEHSILVKDPGTFLGSLEKETLSMVLDLKNRVCQRLLMLGMRVNDGYCNAALTCRGVVDGSAWDPEVNSLAVNMQPAKELREAVAGATVTVTGTVSEAMYVSAAGDAMTKAPSYTVVPGSIYRVEGKNVKVEGDDPSVGIFFVDEDGTETQVPMGQVAVNNPSELRFIVPSTLTDGTYTLRIVTQFANSGTHLLKTPRSAECTVYIGDAAPEGGGTSGGDDDDSGQGTFG